ncbi:hypothetical protein GGX14DRAFT_637452 [Mycena pura]|uniref:Methyltransferase domain-containing protein n=1 Tax=Mycena pura TaxID=153505 RepID=A0AAD6Y831_9AGAR|nr:hypothetical protein GGX14DRAFT_637452 [Mycena pura]
MNVPTPTPLDESLWDDMHIDDGGLEFLKSQTGIDDAGELKKHILPIQAKAYEVREFPMILSSTIAQDIQTFSYTCIRQFAFARLRVSKLPAYFQAMALLRERPDAIFLDLGCCFGTDIRKVAVDGCPMQNLIACDLHGEFWNFGHELFRSTPETFPVAFLSGDVFGPAFLVPAAPRLTSTSSTVVPPSNLSNITSLTALTGHVSVLHCSYVFHLFSEQKQAELARLLAGLLSPLPGSMIFGSQMGKETRGYLSKPPFYSGDAESQVFIHSPESWIDLWEDIFPKGTGSFYLRLKGQTFSSTIIPTQKLDRSSGMDHNVLLDESLWDVMHIDDGGLEFLKSQTGIDDAGELKKHVLAIQAKAYQIFSYPCIRHFTFARLRLSGLPAYSQAMALLRERPDAIFLDLGCCFGTDIRKVAVDGFPMQNLIACDLHGEFWNHGHELFRSTPETFPVAFLSGDVFDPAFLAPSSSASTMMPPSNLSNITSLTALAGHVSILHCSYVFHLFDEQKQAGLARLLAVLLSPLPGSMSFGSQPGMKTKGFFSNPAYYSGDPGRRLFAHSPESWIDLWGGIFPEGTVRLEAALKKPEECHPSQIHPTSKAAYGVMIWSITRL